MHPELREDVPHVVALGARGDVEPACDRDAVEARGQELQDLTLARGEALDQPALVELALAPATRETQQLDDLVQLHQGLAGPHPADRGDDFVQVGGLAQHGCRALLDRARDARPVGMGAEDQRLDVGVAVVQGLDEVRTVAVRQLEAQDRHVDAVEHAASLGQRPAWPATMNSSSWAKASAIASRMAAWSSTSRTRTRSAGPLRCPSGTRSLTRVPPEGGCSTRRSPPSSSARSRMPGMPWPPAESGGRGTPMAGPSSPSRARRAGPSRPARTSTRDAEAWRPALVSASPRMRRTWMATSRGGCLGTSAEMRQ